MGGAARALGVVVLLGFVACGGPIDARLPGGVPNLTTSVDADPGTGSTEPRAEQPALSPQSNSTGFGGSGAAGTGEEEAAAQAVSAQSLLWTRQLIGGMGFRPVGH